MIERLAELNRVLIATSDLMVGNRSAKRARVLDLCASMVIEGRLPNHEATIAFAVRLGLLTESSGDLILSDAGAEFLELNQEKLYDLSHDQCRLLLRNCFLDGPLRSDTLEALRAFEPAFQDTSFRWSSVDNLPLQCPSWLTDHLRELGLLKITENGFEVTAEYVPTVASFLEEGSGWSEDSFQRYLEEKKEVGSLAEDIIVKYEKERLAKKSHMVESRCVRCVSRLRVNAGYDVESFDGKTPHLNFNRFIEVKGSKGRGLRFFWSENEMQVARNLKDKYWIYYLGGIDMKKRRSSQPPVLFQNPIDSVLKHQRLKKLPQGIIVEGALSDA